MIWLLSSIGAHLCWAVSNITDKYFVVNKVKNPYFYIFATSIFEALIALLFIPFLNISVPSAENLFWITLNQVLFVLGNLLYIKAVKIEDITRINILWNFIPIFNLIIAWLTIGEVLSKNEVAALLVFMAGALIASLHSKGKGFRFSKAFWIMLISCLSFSGSAVAVKHVTESENFLNTFFWSMPIMGAISILPFISKSLRQNSAEDLKNIKKLLPPYIGVSMVFLLGMFLNYFAVSKGPVSLVYAMEAFQVLFVFIITIGISLLTKVNLKEELDKKNLLLKFAALLTLILGIVILNLN